MSNISNSNYNTINISGGTSPLATLNNSQGYIFAPYIVVINDSTIIDNEIYKKLLRESRIRKLENLKNLYE